MVPEKKTTAALLMIASLIGLFGGQVSSKMAKNMIGTGSIISPSYPGKSSWSSASRKFAFGFYPEGSYFSVGIQFFLNSSYSTVIWTADRDRKPLPANATLTFGNEGLVLRLDEGDETVSDQYDGTSQLNFASMLDSGNFVVYDASDKIAWQTFDTPTDTLMAGQTIHVGQNLISSVSANNHSSGRFRLAMQREGNFALYPVNTPETEYNAYWVLESSVNYSLSQFIVSSQNSSQEIGLVCFLRIDTDDYLRIYSNQFGLMVSEHYPSMDNKCLIKLL